MLSSLPETTCQLQRWELWSTDSSKDLAKYMRQGGHYSKFLLNEYISTGQFVKQKFLFIKREFIKMCLSLFGSLHTEDAVCLYRVRGEVKGLW